MTPKLLRPLALSASILILGATSTAALAQPAPPPPAPMAGMRDAEGHRHQRPDPAARAQHHAERLRAALQLTPAQEPALNAYVGSMKRPEGDHHRRGGREAFAAMSTPERLDRMKVRMDEHRARFEQHAAATKRFYAQLSPSQQKAFDTMASRHGGHHRHGPERGERG